MRLVKADEVPEELLSRVRAATGQPAYLTIHQRSEGSEAVVEQYLVEAISGDRVTVMHLGTRTDASVSEATDSFLLSEVVDIAIVETGAQLVVGPVGRKVPVTREMASAVEKARSSQGG